MNDREKDIAYLTRRLADAEFKAQSAVSAPARLAHADLARLYREALAVLEQPGAPAMLDGE